jgi:pyruvate formate lyase activating enzyme
MQCGNCVETCPNNVHFFLNGTHKLQRNNCILCGKCIDTCPTSRRNLKSGALSLPTISIDAAELFDVLWPQLEVVKEIGGLTISGGEALLQKEAVLELVKYCKKRGIHTAIETALALPVESYQYVSKYIDCWLIGMRDSYLNNSNSHLSENIQYFSKMREQVIVRYPAIKGYTMGDDQLLRLAENMKLGGFKNIEILPCNKNMLHYYILLGRMPEFNINEVVPGEEEIRRVFSFFSDRGLDVRVVS